MIKIIVISILTKIITIKNFAIIKQPYNHVLGGKKQIVWSATQQTYREWILTVKELFPNMLQ